jgi:hypothetical protein
LSFFCYQLLINRLTKASENTQQKTPELSEVPQGAIAPLALFERMSSWATSIANLGRILSEMHLLSLV